MALIFWYFIFYSFLGFVLEVLFARLTHSVKHDRKCMLILPLCPVYGFGALLIISLPAFIQRNPFLLFSVGALTATVVEYAMDWFYEKFFKVRFWDYSDMPWNVNGRVCLMFSGMWGILALVLIAWVHPLAVSWISAIPASLFLPAFLFLLLDLFFTTLLLRSSETTESLRWYDRFHSTAKEKS